MDSLSLPAPTSPTLDAFSWPEFDASQIDAQLGSAVAPSTIWLAFLITAVFSILMVIILRWHWKKYALNTKTERKMTLIFLVVLVGLGVLLVAAIIRYQNLV